MAKDVTVKRTPAAVGVGARLDDAKLDFVNGTATKKCEPGTHVLVYFHVAEPGTVFTIEITDPPEARWSRNHRIPSDGVTIGFKKFQVDP